MSGVRQALIEHYPQAASFEAWAAKPTAVDSPGMKESTVPLYDGAGETQVGVWSCTPGRATSARDGYDEYCYFVAGRATIETEGAEPIDVVAGDAIVLRDGWKGAWVIHETLTKTYSTVKHG